MQTSSCLKTIRLISAALLLIFSNVACSSQPIPDSQVLSYFFNHSTQNINAIESCYIFIPKQYVHQGKWTLSEDLAYYISKLSNGNNSIETSCEHLPNSNVICRVNINHAVGELVWNRVYRFKYDRSNQEYGELSDLECFTIP